MKKLVVLDLDGTLLDTLDDLSESVNYALSTLGYPIHTKEDCRRFIGNGIGKLLERALPDAYKNEEMLSKMKALFFEHYGNNMTTHTKPYEGVVEMLNFCVGKGIKLSVASNKYQSAVIELVDHYFSDFDFSAVLGQREGVPEKPDPVIVYDILEECGLAKEEVLFIGDSSVDVKTAQNSGVDVCAVTWGLGSKKDMEKMNPTYMVDKPNEIYEILMSN